MRSGRLVDGEGRNGTTWPSQPGASRAPAIIPDPGNMRTHTVLPMWNAAAVLVKGVRIKGRRRVEGNMMTKKRMLRRQRRKRQAGPTPWAPSMPVGRKLDVEESLNPPVRVQSHLPACA
ncbi:hypothetical protein CSOJ01_02720 [Colletotrichum sojae]|uniref:Uncharacterized protein n=1 Tax=Colletotrichum sojae TaxID=2175907 RepID=A0A8H6JP31_9PEZI|nr:hypothetical protein CSOJ01_02720 [Colletotrichum sojae]